MANFSKWKKNPRKTKNGNNYYHFPYDENDFKKAAKNSGGIIINIYDKNMRFIEQVTTSVKVLIKYSVFNYVQTTKREEDLSKKYNESSFFIVPKSYEEKLQELTGDVYDHSEKVNYWVFKYNPLSGHNYKLNDFSEDLKNKEIVPWNRCPSEIKKGDIIFFFNTKPDEFNGKKIKKGITCLGEFVEGESIKYLKILSNPIYDDYLKIKNPDIRNKIKGKSQNDTRIGLSIDEGKELWEMALDEKENNGVNIMGKNQIENYPLNLILYGPPGTGKTYNTINKALEIIDGFVPKDREGCEERFSELRKSGQIEFITFHQSYSYEDFVEGIKPDLNAENEQMKFRLNNGIFKEICEKAKTKRSSSYDFDEKKIQFHKMSLGDTLANEDDIYNYCIRDDVISLGYGGDINYSNIKNEEDIIKAYSKKYPGLTSFGATAIIRFKNVIKKGDIIVVSKGNRSIRAIGKVTGEYYYNDQSPIRFNHFRKVEWLYKDGEISVKQILKDKWLSQQSIYTFYDKDIIIDNLKELLTGDDKPKNHVLIIDEINRGNISRIFGELITLIEEDKRDGKLTAKLPYSQEDFTVPSNLFIIGTMNTADRSIALLDIALRRRFTFFRFDPDSSLVNFVKAKNIMEKLNSEIVKSKGKDFQIGHSYFMKVNSDEELKTVLKYKIKPLLEEYFVNDSNKLENLIKLIDEGI